MTHAAAASDDNHNAIKIYSAGELAPKLKAILPIEEFERMRWERNMGQADVVSMERAGGAQNAPQGIPSSSEIGKEVDKEFQRLMELQYLDAPQGGSGFSLFGAAAGKAGAHNASVLSGSLNYLDHVNSRIESAVARGDGQAIAKAVGEIEGAIGKVYEGASKVRMDNKMKKRMADVLTRTTDTLQSDAVKDLVDPEAKKRMEEIMKAIKALLNKIFGRSKGASYDA